MCVVTDFVILVSELFVTVSAFGAPVVGLLSLLVELHVARVVEDFEGVCSHSLGCLDALASGAWTDMGLCSRSETMGKRETSRRQMAMARYSWTMWVLKPLRSSFGIRRLSKSA